WCIAGDEVAVEAQLLGAALEDERVVPRDLGADLLHVERSFDLVEQRREPFGSPGRAEVPLPLAQHAVRGAEADGAVDERAAADRSARGERNQHLSLADHHAAAGVEMAESPRRLADQIGRREGAALFEDRDFQTGSRQLGGDRGPACAGPDHGDVGLDPRAGSEVGGGMESAGQHQFSAREGLQPSAQPQAARASPDSKYAMPTWNRIESTAAAHRYGFFSQLLTQAARRCASSRENRPRNRGNGAYSRARRPVLKSRRVSGCRSPTAASSLPSTSACSGVGPPGSAKSVCASASAAAASVSVSHFRPRIGENGANIATPPVAPIAATPAPPIRNARLPMRPTGPFYAWLQQISLGSPTDTASSAPRKPGCLSVDLFLNIVLSLRSSR